MYFENPVRYLHGHGIFCGVLNCFKNKKVHVSVIPGHMASVLLTFQNYSG